MPYNTTLLLLTPCSHNHMRTIFCGETKGLSLDDGPRTCLHNQTAPSNIRTHANTTRRPPERVDTCPAHISSCRHSTRFSLYSHTDTSPHTSRAPADHSSRPPNGIHRIPPSLPHRNPQKCLLCDNDKLSKRPSNRSDTPCHSDFI